MDDKGCKCGGGCEVSESKERLRDALGIARALEGVLCDDPALSRFAGKIAMLIELELKSA